MLGCSFGGLLFFILYGIGAAFLPSAWATKTFYQFEYAVGSYLFFYIVTFLAIYLFLFIILPYPYHVFKTIKNKKRLPR